MAVQPHLFEDCLINVRLKRHDDLGLETTMKVEYRLHVVVSMRSLLQPAEMFSPTNLEPLRAPAIVVRV